MPLVATALQAFQNEIIVTLSKLFDNTKCDDIVSIYSLINIFEKNESSFDVIWQKDKYNEFCDKPDLSVCRLTVPQNSAPRSLPLIVKNLRDASHKCTRAGLWTAAIY